MFCTWLLQWVATREAFLAKRLTRRETCTPARREERDLISGWEKRRETCTPARREERDLISGWEKRRETCTPARREERDLISGWEIRRETCTPARREERDLISGWDIRRETCTPVDPCECSSLWLFRPLSVPPSECSARTRGTSYIYWLRDNIIMTTPCRVSHEIV